MVIYAAEVTSQKLLKSKTKTMDAATAKQQVVERLKQANNILVTVSNNPSVDQLAACIGMTLFLNKLEKTATAVFSGNVPSTIEFLQPEKTLEPTTDSLRDFIISLDKTKADKLRYKVEDKFVRIFITPYRGAITQQDLIFEEGDFNVEVVLALGVRDRNQLDAAITAHGRILHDATVISVNAGANNAPNIGQVNWQEPGASSLSEMLVSISEAFGTGLIDNQMATAFLTGIVAQTNRFSNEKTSPKVMTMAAQLMAAGANQKLIVSKLEPQAPPPPAPPKPPPPPPKPPAPPKPPPPPAPPPKPPAPKPKPKPPQLKPEGEIDVARDGDKQGKTEIEVHPTEIKIDEQGRIIQLDAPKDAQKPLAITLPEPSVIAPAPPSPEVKKPLLEEAAEAIDKLASGEPLLGSANPAAPSQPATAPSQPVATSQPVAPIAPPPALEPQLPPLPAEAPPAHIIPEHHGMFLGEEGAAPMPQPVPVSDTPPSWAAPYDLVPMDPYSKAAGINEDAPSGRANAWPSQSQSESWVDEIGVSHSRKTPTQNTQEVVGDARSAVESALAGVPFNPAYAPPAAALNAQPAVQVQHTQGDTPVFQLPGQPAPVAVPAQPVEMAAPPPVPPPLPQMAVPTSQ